MSVERSYVEGWYLLVRGGRFRACAPTTLAAWSPSCLAPTDPAGSIIIHVFLLVDAGSSGHRIYIMAPMIASFLRQGISNLGFVRWDEFVEPLANCDSSLRLIREREGRDEELGVLVEEGKCISKAAWKSVHKGWGSVKVARNVAGGGWLYRSPAWQGQPARNRETVLPPMNADPLSFSSLSLSLSSPTRGDHFFPLKGFFYTEKHPFWLGFCGETILSHVRGDDERRFRYKKLLIFFFFSNAKRRWTRSFFIFCPDFLRKLGW